MRSEPVAEKIVLSKEDYQYYQQRIKECKVFHVDTFNTGFRHKKNYNKNSYASKRYRSSSK